MFLMEKKPRTHPNLIPSQSQKIQQSIYTVYYVNKNSSQKDKFTQPQKVPQKDLSIFSKNKVENKRTNQNIF